MKLTTKATVNPAGLLMLLCVACVLVAAGCATSQPNLPSITEETTGAHYPGKIIWHDLITHTPEASKRFYSELFGWEFEDLGLDFGAGRTFNYTLIRHRGKLIGGMVDANRLVGVLGGEAQFRALRRHMKPVDRIAYSFLVYRIRPEDVAVVRGPD